MDSSEAQSEDMPMAFLSRLLILAGPAIATACLPAVSLAQQLAPHCISPALATEKRGTAPGMKVRLISEGTGEKQYAVIFSSGDEAYSGLLDFAEKYHVTSGHFTAIGALSSAVLAWYDRRQKLYCENRIEEQVEAASMIGNFALYQGK